MSSNPAANNENNEAFVKKQKAHWWGFDRPWLALLSLFMTFISGSMIGVTYDFVVHRYTCPTVNNSWLGTFEHGFITEEVCMFLTQDSTLGFLANILIQSLLRFLRSIREDSMAM